MKKTLITLLLALAMLIGVAGPAMAHSGVRFQLSSASESGTRIYYHGADGVTRSKFLEPGTGMVYPTGGHLESVRVLLGWKLSGLKNGNSFSYTCTLNSQYNNGDYCYYPLWGSYVAKYIDV